jgi:hypothetical protein
MISVSWPDIKGFIADRKDVSLQWLDLSSKYHVFAFDGPFSLRCLLPQDGGAEQLDFEANYKATGNKSVKSEVITLFEKNDKDLKCCSGTVQVDPATGIGVVEIQIPATGRWMNRGNAFFTATEPNRATGIEVCTPPTGLPANTLYPGQPALPPGYPLKSYHDDEMPAVNQGFRVPAIASGALAGVSDVETLAGYGWIPGGLVVRITGKMSGVAPFSGWFSINMENGKNG